MLDPFMTARIQTLLLLFTILVAIDIGAQRLQLPRSILLVIAGIMLPLVPGLPRFELAPEVVLLVIAAERDLPEDVQTLVQAHQDHRTKQLPRDEKASRSRPRAQTCGAS